MHIYGLGSSTVYLKSDGLNHSHSKTILTVYSEYAIIAGNPFMYIYTLPFQKLDSQLLNCTYIYQIV
jgi:hypothetical protein